MKETKAVVLSSGGLDSTVCLGLAVKTFGSKNVTSVSIYYGQKHSKELECAYKIANYYQIDHKVLDLSEIFKESNCPLLDNSTDSIPEGPYSEQQKESKDGIVSTYVPFRNGLMLSAVASYAMSIYPEDVITLYLGNHADDAAGNAYPDCSEEFSKLISDAIYWGSGKKVIPVSPFVNSTKTDIVSLGIDLNVPFVLTWSCYKGGDKACGRCGTCIDRLKAFKANGMQDPIEYESYDLQVVDDIDMKEKTYITWEDVEKFIAEVCATIEENQYKFDGIFGLPKGGLLLAVMLSYKTNLPILFSPTQDSLIVDTICDSGESLLQYMNNFHKDNFISAEKPTIFTMFYKPNKLKVIPDFYRYEKGEQQIVFPWESK